MKMQNNKLKLAMLTLVLILATGCANFQFGERDQLQVPVTYGTMKVIERDNGIDRDSVLIFIDRLETLIAMNEQVIVLDLKAQVVSLINMDNLSQADRYLITTVLDDIEFEIKRTVDGDGTIDGAVMRIADLIDYVKLGASLSE